jgi:hypothetical protein
MFGGGFSRHIRGKDPAKLVQSVEYNTFRRNKNELEIFGMEGIV